MVVQELVLRNLFPSGLGVMGLRPFAYAVPSLWDTLPSISGPVNFFLTFGFQLKGHPLTVLSLPSDRQPRPGHRRLAGKVGEWKNEGAAGLAVRSRGWRL